MVAAVGLGLAAGSSILGGINGANAAKSAGSAINAAGQEAAGYDQGVYNTASTNLNPYISTGTNALSSLAQFYGLAPSTGSTTGASGTSGTNGNALAAFNSFTQTPYYQFPLQQGIQAQNQSAAAKGLSLSPGQEAAVNAYGQGYASQQLGSYLSALSSLANLGQSSSTSLAGIGNQSASLSQNALMQGAQGEAAGTVGAANSINQGVSNALPFITGGSTSSGGLLGLFNGGGYSGAVDAGSWGL